MIRAAAVIAGSLVVSATPGWAQSFGGRIGIASFRTEQVSPAGDTTARDGIGFGIEGAAGIGPVTLALRYAQATLSGDDPARDGDLIDGEALLWLAPVRWAAIGAGPHARAYVKDDASERWLLWELRVQGNARLTGGVTGYLEGWTAVGSDVPVPETVDRALGLEGGLRLAAGRLPVSARLRYRVEQLELGDGARRETVEQLGLAIGIGRR